MGDLRITTSDLQVLVNETDFRTVPKGYVIAILEDDHYIWCNVLCSQGLVRAHKEDINFNSKLL